MIRLRLIVTTAALLILAFGLAPTRALASESAPPYQLSVDLDIPVLLLGGAMASSYFLMSEAAPPACAPVCNRSNVNAFDRPFAGRYSRPWQTVGDIATASTLVLVPAALLLDERSVAGLRDALIVGEAVLMTSGLEAIVNYAVKRPRPRVYGTKAPLDERDDGNAGRSFYSGHVGNCVAATVAATIILRNEGHPQAAWAIFAFGLAGSAVVGVARVEAGSHFPSDVLAGVAVGTAFGFALPALHAKHVELTPIADSRTQGLAVVGAF
jgi:membrane-associated phospholipid phosphatase